ncbi:MAG: cobalamin-independent methionine synthase II family protein [Gammaproteobacteria bacterium]|nr:cobalamin-independent methionine synthase II family protein [Gammaproteobacteria bacterium]
MSNDKRVLTTHVGSLVRPPEFRAKLEQRIAGELGDDEFNAALRAAVDGVVARQKQAGVDIVSDGEYGKIGGWEQYVIARLSGFGERQELAMEGKAPTICGDHRSFPEFYGEYWGGQNTPEGIYPCVGPITYTGHDELQRDIANLKSAMAKAGVETGFLPVAAPASAFALSPNQYYASDEDYVQAGAAALREEYKAIVDAGLFVQIDDAHLPFQYDAMVPPASKEDYFRWARLRVDALNEALRGIPQDRVRYHICWGSWNGPHTSDVELKEIVHLLLEVNVGAYCIEAANARHEHEWQVWKTVKLPEGRKLVPGCVSHQTNVVEHPELVAERILRFASVVGGENVIAGTDCGFAQGPLMARVHPTIMWAKLEALAQGAKIASRTLWG